MRPEDSAAIAECVHESDRYYNSLLDTMSAVLEKLKEDANPNQLVDVKTQSVAMVIGVTRIAAMIALFTGIPVETFVAATRVAYILADGTVREEDRDSVLREMTRLRSVE